MQESANIGYGFADAWPAFETKSIAAHDKFPVKMRYEILTNRIAKYS